MDSPNDISQCLIWKKSCILSICVWKRQKCRHMGYKRIHSNATFYSFFFIESKVVGYWMVNEKHAHTCTYTYLKWVWVLAKTGRFAVQVVVVLIEFLHFIRCLTVSTVKSTYSVLACDSKCKVVHWDNLLKVNGK